jgi:hypothetical protein
MMNTVVLSAAMAAALVLTPATMARDLNIGTEDMVHADYGLTGDDVVGRDLLASKVVSKKVVVRSGQTTVANTASPPVSPTPKNGDEGVRLRSACCM